MLLSEIKSSETERVIKQLKKSKYYEEITTLEDGTICAIGKVDDGYGLFFDLDEHGWVAQYVYKDQRAALEELKKLTSVKDKPTGFIKVE